jgi:hypothetical protein
LFVTEADILSDFSSCRKEESMEARKERDNSKFASISGEYNITSGEELANKKIGDSIERPNQATRNSMNNVVRPFNRSTRLISAQ